MCRQKNQNTKKQQQRKGTNVQTDQKYFQSRTAGFSPVTVAHLEAVWFSRWIYLDSSSHIQRHALHTYRCTHANKGTKFWGCTQTHKHIHTHTKTRTHAHTYIWIHLHINTYKDKHANKDTEFWGRKSLFVPVICDCSLVINPFSINITFPDPIVKEKIIESAIIGGHIKWHRGLVLSNFNQLRDHRHRFPLFCRDKRGEGGQFVLYRRCAQCVFNRPIPVRASHLNEVNVFTGQCVLLSRQPHLAQSSP